MIATDLPRRAAASLLCSAESRKDLHDGKGTDVMYVQLVPHCDLRRGGSTGVSRRQFHQSRWISIEDRATSRLAKRRTIATNA